MRANHRRVLNGISLLLALGYMACGGGGAADMTGPSAAVLFKLDMSLTQATVAAGESYVLTATPKDESGSSMSGLPLAAFTSSDPSRASVDATGLVTGVAPGTATITATLTVGGVTQTGTCVVTITARLVNPPPGSNVVTTPGTSFLPKSITISINDSVTWRFSGAVHNVTFNGAAPTAGNIPDQQAGNAVTRTFTTAGTFDYECTRHSGMTGTVIVQGTTAGVFTSLRLTPATATILPGGTVQLTATPLDQNGTAMAGLPAATFTSSNAAIATVSATGLGTGVGAGTATLTASLTANGVTLTATASVTVSAPPTTGASVTTPSNTFSPAIVTINAGETVTWFFSGTVHNVTFNGAAPTGGNIPDQQVGASVSRTFPTAGTHNYECTRHGGMTGTVIVQGTTAGVFTSLRLTPATATMLPGGTVQLTATPLDQNGTAMTGLPAATFTSSSAAIATVSATGLGTGVGAGTATLTASLTANGVTMTATASVTVGAISGATVTTSALSFQPERVTIRPGESVTWQFSGTVHNVVFIDRAPPQGNIPDTQPGQSVSRTFPSADQYDYRCTLHEAMKGRVIVEQD